MKKRLLIYVILWLFLSAALSAPFIYYYKTFDFTFLQFGKIIDEESLVLLDKTSQKNTFLYVKNNRIKKRMEYDIVDGDRYNDVLSVMIDGGTVWFNNFYNHLGYMEYNLEFCRLDLEEGKIRKEYEITNLQLKQLAHGETFQTANYFIKDGKVTLLVYTYNEEMKCFRLYQYQCANGKNGQNYVVSEFQDNASDFYITSDGVIGFEVHQGTICAENRDFGMPAYYAIYSISEDRFLGRRISGEGFDEINVKTGEYYPENFGFYQALKDQNIKSSEVRDISLYGGRMILCCDDQDACLVEYKDGTIRRIKSLSYWGTMECFLCFLLFAVILLLLMPVFAFLWKKLFSQYVMMKMLLLVIPVLCICDLIAYVSIQEIMMAENMHSMEESLTLVSRQYESLGLTDKIEDFSCIYDEESTDYYSLNYIREIIAAMPNLHTEIERHSNIKDDFIFETTFYGIDQTSGNYFDLYRGIDFTIENTNAPYLARSAMKAVREKKPVFDHMYDSSGQYFGCVIYPVKNKEGEVNGFYLVKASEPEIIKKPKDIMKKVIAYEMHLNIIIVSIMLVALWMVLRPLNKLKKQAISLMKTKPDPGESGKRQQKYVNEIGIIRMHFDRMVLSVQDNLSEIEKLRLGNSRYFSDYLLELLHKKSIAMINFREDETTELYYIHARLSKEYTSFDRFRDFMGKICGKFDAYRAFIGRIDGRDILILSKDRLLIGLMYYMLRLDPEIYAVFDFARMNISVSGLNERYRFSCICEEQKRFHELDRFQEELSAHLVVTQRVYRTEEDNHNIICNCIGMVEKEYVYEIMVGAANRKKKLIVGLLKEAVGYFFLHEYEQARFLFVRVLKLDGENTAARYYIDEIEKRLRSDLSVDGQEVRTS